MLKKSKKSAFVMGCIYIMTALFSSVALKALSTPKTGLKDLIFDPNASSLSPNVKVFSWVLLFFLIMLTGGVISWAINKFDEAHFGIRGAFLWAVAGFIYAAWIRFVVHGLPNFGVQSDKVIEAMLNIAGISISYGIPFGFFRSVWKLGSKDNQKEN